MAKNPLLTETTADSMLKILKQSDYECALNLHNWAKNSGCKIASRTGAHYYRIQYNTTKPKRSLFTIECNEKRWRIKANLYHLSQYNVQAERVSSNIKTFIKETRTCTGCNSRCIGGSHFELDGKSYFTCIGSGHFFESMSKAEWKELKGLLQLEQEIIIGI